MRIGLVVPQRETLEATLAGFEQGEDLGVRSLWFSQPADGYDALTVLAMAAARTDRVRLGTAVVPTFPSHPLLTARSARTAAAAAPGRIVLGVGAGHRTWVERDYGQRFDHPVRRVTEWVLTARRLLDGEPLSPADNAFGLTAAATDVKTAVPIVVAATGPKMLAAAGRVADAALTWMCDEAYLAEVVVPHVARGAAAVQRPEPPIVVGALVCVTDDAERTRAELQPRLRPLAGYESYQAVLAHGTRPARTPADVALVGREDKVAEALGRLASVGAAELVAVVVPDPRDPARSVERSRRLLGALAVEAEPAGTTDER